jgi:hypothetical protein
MPPAIRMSPLIGIITPVNLLIKHINFQDQHCAERSVTHPSKENPVITLCQLGD